MGLLTVVTAVVLVLTVCSETILTTFVWSFASEGITVLTRVLFYQKRFEIGVYNIRYSLLVFIVLKHDCTVISGRHFHGHGVLAVAQRFMLIKGAFVIKMDQTTFTNEFSPVVVRYLRANESFEVTDPRVMTRTLVPQQKQISMISFFGFTHFDRIHEVLVITILPLF